MKTIPQDLNYFHNSLLVQKEAPEKYNGHYKKWVRYYLDFCRKYDFRESVRESLTPFIDKLKEKKQSNQKQKQAVNAISLLYGYYSTENEKIDVFKTNKETISSKKYGLKVTNAGWVPYNDKNTENKLRDYSDNTLRTYTTWTRQFQAFTKSKDLKAPYICFGIELL